MKTIKKMTSWLLVAAMLGGTFIPALEGKAAGESLPKVATREAATEDATTESVTTQEATTESRTTESVTTQEATTENGTTENVTITEKNPELVDTGLSPATAKVIVLDPGHCNRHPGASGHGLREERVVLDIAKECQSKLNVYGDVTVYMTREDGGCCVNLGVGDCLAGRNNYAKLLDADFLISMHINAGSSNGANVLAAYKSGYHDTIRKKTQAFGKVALSKLSEIGIKDRGFLLRKSGTGNRYSNGRLADYYSIVRNGVIQNVPSVIIEHGYVTSSSDCNKFFKSKAKRKKVGNADAKAIIAYNKLKKKTVQGKFKKISGETYYVISDDKKAAGWIKDNGKWYYFDETTGKMQTGFITIGEDTFYLNPKNGQMTVGWFKVSGNTYLTRGNGTLVKGQAYSDGRYTYLFASSGKQMKKGLHTLNGATYYLNSKRRASSGIVKVKGKYYGFDTETCQMVYGYQKIKSKYYYLDPDTGVMARKKIITVQGSKYYFGSSGARQTGWVKYKSNKYYFNTKSGKMTTGWKKIKGKYYYFDKKSGKMQKNKWIGKYYVNGKGVRSKKK